MAPSIIACDSLFSGMGNTMNPLSPSGLFSVTNTPESKENFFSCSASNYILFPLERNSVTACLAVLTKRTPSESDNLVFSDMIYLLNITNCYILKKH